MIFYPGLHQPSDARHLDRAFISVNRLRRRRKALGSRAWIMDSGAFTEIATHGRYRQGVEDYAAQINRWAGQGLIAAVSQDYMCEPFILSKTGLTVADHQRLTIERYDALLPLVTGVYVMPVLQGYTVADYLRHLAMYGDRLGHGAYVGVGSICKRNVNVAEIEDILLAIRRARPDLRLHGFGLKATALASAAVQDCLASADSMAWSYSAASKAGILVRKLGRELGRRVKPSEARVILADRGILLPNPNDWRAALEWAERIESAPTQTTLLARAAA